MCPAILCPAEVDHACRRVQLAISKPALTDGDGV